MKPATLHQIKKELETISPQRLMNIALRLIKYKAENKELVSYMLFDEDNLADYISDLKVEISEMLKDVNSLPLYMVKRTLKKTIRFITRFSRYTQIKETEAELLIHFCRLSRDMKLYHTYNKSVNSIYFRQIEKISKLIPKFNEDLQVDYQEEIKKLMSPNY